MRKKPGKAMEVSSTISAAWAQVRGSMGISGESAGSGASAGHSNWRTG